MACIELKDVSYRYPTSPRKNLKNINLTVESGEFIAVIGRNEAGKTTLCNVIRGFAPHFYSGKISGSVTVNGKDVLKTEIGDLSGDVGYVFQNPDDQIFKYNVLDEVMFGPLNIGMSQAEAKEKALADGVVSRNAWEKAPLTASSDSGDVSQMMPMNLFTAVCWPVGVAPHTWQSCASAGSTIGQKGAFYAAKVIAATAYDLYTQPELRKEIQDEFDAQDREPYAPMYDGE